MLRWGGFATVATALSGSWIGTAHIVRWHDDSWSGIARRSGVVVIDSVRKSHIGFEPDLELRSGRAAKREYINVLPMSMPASHPDSLPRGLPRGEGIARFR